MSKPFVLVQLSDPHVGATWFAGDPVALLTSVVEAVCTLETKPDAVLVSGDLADSGADNEYDQVRELVATVGAPVYALPGNHDDRQAMRRHFDLPGADHEPVQYAVNLGPVRLVALDSTRRGEDSGELDGERLSWLEETLAADRKTPTVLAMHHPPLITGVPAWDEILFPESERQALGRIVATHSQLHRIVGGHLHRAVVGGLKGQSVLAIPSTSVQAQPSLGATELPLSREFPGYAVHTLIDGQLASYIQSVPT